MYACSNAHACECYGVCVYAAGLVVYDCVCMCVHAHVHVCIVLCTCDTLSTSLTSPLPANSHSGHCYDIFAIQTNASLSRLHIECMYSHFSLLFSYLPMVCLAPLSHAIQDSVLNMNDYGRTLQHEGTPHSSTQVLRPTLFLSTIAHVTDYRKSQDPKTTLN